MIKLLKILTVCLFMVSLACNSEKEIEKKIGNDLKVLESPAVGNSMQPYLFSDDEQVLMSWTQKIKDTLYTLNYATFKEGKWTKATEVAKGTDWFVNWADFPAIAKNKNQLLAYFLQRSDTATFAYDVQLKQSENNGENWKEAKKLHQDSTLTEHGFVTILPNKEEGFFVSWLDGRNTQKGDHGDTHQSKGAMQIRTATVLPDGEIVNDTMVDSKTCDCCQTSGVISPNGPIIVYRDRTDAEVRDIYISRFVDNSWTAPKAIHNDNWIINGCPVNGPKADALKKTLVVAWFTAANNRPKVQLVFSGDQGEKFDKPLQISDKKPLGRVDVALVDEKNALVSWMETTVEGAVIKMVKVARNGSRSKPVVIENISSSRSSGFPQFELINQQVIMAWNDEVDGELTVKTVIFPLEVLYGS